ncbi:MAG: NrsF family protein [Sphingosinicella sp.]
MSRMPTEELVETLAAIAAPVRPLAPPVQRAALALAALLALGALAVLLWGDVAGMFGRYEARTDLLAIEMAAMLATAATAILAAFIISVPGRSKAWALAPIVPFLAWLGASGLGCLQELVLGPPTSGWGHAPDCLIFILAAGVLIAVPLFWMLRRARPIEPLRVATLGGLGAAALAALLLQFFHPFALTLLDLAVHFGAVLAIAAAAALVRRHALAPATG